MADATAKMEPAVRDMLDATSHRARAQSLLRLPDTVLLKYHGVFERALLAASFEAGLEFVALRYATLAAVRDVNGCLPARLFSALEGQQGLMVRYAAGTDDL